MGEHIHKVTGYVAGWNNRGELPDAANVSHVETAWEALEVLAAKAYKGWHEFADSSIGDQWWSLYQEIRAYQHTAKRYPCETYEFTAPDRTEWFVEVQTDCD